MGMGREGRPPPGGRDGASAPERALAPPAARARGEPRPRGTPGLLAVLVALLLVHQLLYRLYKSAAACGVHGVVCGGATARGVPESCRRSTVQTSRSAALGSRA